MNFRYASSATLSPSRQKFLVCPGGTSPSNHDTQNALDVIVGPLSANEISCGVQSPAMLAGAGIRMREGHRLHAHDSASQARLFSPSCNGVYLCAIYHDI
jgi:hypothetical protein